MVNHREIRYFNLQCNKCVVCLRHAAGYPTVHEVLISPQQYGLLVPYPIASHPVPPSPSPLATFTGLTKQSYRAGEDKEEGERRGRKEGRREKNKDKRDKKGNHRACAKAEQEHATLTTVRLGAYYSDYGAIGSILQ